VAGRQQCITSHSSDGAKTASNPSRQKEGTRRKHSLEVERRQLSRVTHPMIGNDGSAGIADESLNRKNQNEDIIDFTNEWNEVGN
jgi:hypothetical protein